MTDVICVRVDRRAQSAADRTPLSMFRWVSKSSRLTACRKSMVVLWNRANATLRSACGHWKTQSTTKHSGLDFGPALRRLADGSLQPRIETQARIRGIDNLLAIRPWADIVDMQIFLDGFEAGAQWCRHNPHSDSEAGKHAEA